MSVESLTKVLITEEKPLLCSSVTDLSGFYGRTDNVITPEAFL